MLEKNAFSHAESNSLKRVKPLDKTITSFAKYNLFTYRKTRQEQAKQARQALENTPADVPLSTSKQTKKLSLKRILLGLGLSALATGGIVFGSKLADSPKQTTQSGDSTPQQEVVDAATLLQSPQVQKELGDLAQTYTQLDTNGAELNVAKVDAIRAAQEAAIKVDGVTDSLAHNLPIMAEVLAQKTLIGGDTNNERVQQNYLSTVVSSYVDRNVAGSAVTDSEKATYKLKLQEVLNQALERQGKDVSQLAHLTMDTALENAFKIAYAESITTTPETTLGDYQQYAFANYNIYHDAAWQEAKVAPAIGEELEVETTKTERETDAEVTTPSEREGKPWHRRALEGVGVTALLGMLGGGYAVMKNKQRGRLKEKFAAIPGLDGEENTENREAALEHFQDAAKELKKNSPYYNKEECENFAVEYLRTNKPQDTHSVSRGKQFDSQWIKQFQEAYTKHEQKKRLQEALNTIILSKRWSHQKKQEVHSIAKQTINDPNSHVALEECFDKQGDIIPHQIDGKLIQTANTELKETLDPEILTTLQGNYDIYNGSIFEGADFSDSTLKKLIFNEALDYYATGELTDLHNERDLHRVFLNHVESMYKQRKNIIRALRNGEEERLMKTKLSGDEKDNAIQEYMNSLTYKPFDELMELSNKLNIKVEDEPAIKKSEEENASNNEEPSKDTSSLKVENLTAEQQKLLGQAKERLVERYSTKTSIVPNAAQVAYWPENNLEAQFILRIGGRVNEIINGEELEDIEEMQEFIDTQLDDRILDQYVDTLIAYLNKKTLSEAQLQKLLSKKIDFGANNEKTYEPSTFDIDSYEQMVSKNPAELTPGEIAYIAKINLQCNLQSEDPRVESYIRLNLTPERKAEIQEAANSYAEKLKVLAPWPANEVRDNFIPTIKDLITDIVIQKLDDSSFNPELHLADYLAEDVELELLNIYEEIIENYYNERKDEQMQWKSGKEVSLLQRDKDFLLTRGGSDYDERHLAKIKNISSLIKGIYLDAVNETNPTPRNMANLFRITYLLNKEWDSLTDEEKSFSTNEETGSNQEQQEVEFTPEEEKLIQEAAAKISNKITKHALLPPDHKFDSTNTLTRIKEYSKEYKQDRPENNLSTFLDGDGEISASNYELHEYSKVMKSYYKSLNQQQQQCDIRTAYNNIRKALNTIKLVGNEELDQKYSDSNIDNIPAELERGTVSSERFIQICFIHYYISEDIANLQEGSEEGLTPERKQELIGKAAIDIDYDLNQNFMIPMRSIIWTRENIGDIINEEVAKRSIDNEQDLKNFLNNQAEAIISNMAYTYLKDGILPNLDSEELTNYITYLTRAINALENRIYTSSTSMSTLLGEDFKNNYRELKAKTLDKENPTKEDISTLAFHMYTIGRAEDKLNWS